jgi:hypothetical protein
MRALVLEQRATDHVVHAIGVSESIAPVARADHLVATADYDGWFAPAIDTEADSRLRRTR